MLQQRGCESKNIKHQEIHQLGVRGAGVHAKTSMPRRKWSLCMESDMRYRCMFTIKEIIILITRFCNSYGTVIQTQTKRRIISPARFTAYTQAFVFKTLPRGTLQYNIVELSLTDNYARIAISTISRHTVYCTYLSFPFIWAFLSLSILSSVITEEKDWENERERERDRNLGQPIVALFKYQKPEIKDEITKQKDRKRGNIEEACPL